jgi:hypothetical protein
MKKIITIFTITTITLFTFWFSFGKELYYKNKDFKKISGKIESCNVGDTIINKYTDKDGKLILSGINNEHIPCITVNRVPTEMCESVISLLSNCVTVFDNVSDKKVYDLKINSSIPSIKDSILKNEIYLNEYNLKKEIEENKTLQVRKYKNIDYEVTLKNERGIVFGQYLIKDVKNNKETKGEWIGSEANLNKLFIDQSENTFLIKGAELVYTKDKVSSILKLIK